MLGRNQTTDGVDHPIAGQLLDRRTQEPLVGFRVLVGVDAEARSSKLPVAFGAAFSQLDGAFAIPLDPEALERLARTEERITITVENRFGRVVHHDFGVSGRQMLDPLEINIDVREEDDHPSERERPNPFEVFQSIFETEIRALR